MSTKTLALGPVTLHPSRKRSPHESMGRFGGGWQWKLGIQAGTWTRKDGGTVIVSLLVREWRITYRPKGSMYRKEAAK
ncbi:hypothetical protein ACMX2H_16025 [Arthrobacter sulfonylureivorans]|uniref:hypothetical protein n=1 Tax=Arthrobacter sulfonylureivorans TaxID=2486855 RepID=UPI0039E2E6DE